MQEPKAPGVTLKDFIPLISIFIVIIILTLFKTLLLDKQIGLLIPNLMAFFFIIFGTFKIINWSGFVEGYSSYDIIAKRWRIYARIYPLIELTLGFLYLFNLYPTITNVITFIVMSIGSISVALELYKKNKIQCACLGMVFKLPLTYVTLVEDLLMAAMALVMLYF